MRRPPVVAVPLALVLVVALSCEGPGGPPGPGGPDGPGDGPYETGPGLVVTIVDAAIAGGTATTTVELTDADGTPLDRTGARTAGVVNLSFVLAHLGRDARGEATTYTAYTTRVQTAPDGTSAEQAAGESDGTWEALGTARGRYRYTFATPIDVADASATHTVGVYGARVQEGATDFDDDTFDFVPAGGDVEYRREITDDAACARCHHQLAAHGGARRSVALCITCHTPQTVDPDTGHTMDMRVLIHKIHMGKDLPSVRAGTPYVVIGFNQSVHDYSTVGFPAPNTVSHCASCHVGDEWQTHYSAATCASCHDRTWFGHPDQVPAGYTVHGGGQQGDDTCGVCHSVDLPALPPTSVVTAHRVDLFAADRPEPQLAITAVRDTGPGERPTIRFTVAVQGQPRDILAEPLNALRATFAGPNTDFARSWQATIQGPNATGTLVAGDAPGEVVWTAPASAAIPEAATGSYTVGLEANLTSPRGVRIPARAPLQAFAVTDAEPSPRRQIIDDAKCNDCHGILSFHGGNRANAMYCPMCHNPNNVNDERAPRFEGRQVYVHTVQLTHMVHRIHMGEALTQPYVLGGNPGPTEANPQGTPQDFGHVRYPAPRARCSTCHVGESHRLRTSTAGMLPAFDQIFTCTEDPGADDDELCEPFSPATPAQNAFVPIETILLRPQTAACTGCHDAPATYAHALVMTAGNGIESCAVCHGPGGQFEAHGAP
jgi:OmcA/MtrC family decaheme c-type cytochrome